MAERRMFSKTIITSDDFLDMPTSSRCLYFSLCMFADDDGFVNNPKSIVRQVRASNDDMNILLAKGYLFGFENGIIVVRDWKIHNYIQKDRYKETQFLDLKRRLFLDVNKAYTLEPDMAAFTSSGEKMEKYGNVYKLDTQVKLGKDSIGKDSTEEECAQARTHEDDLIVEQTVYGNQSAAILYISKNQISDLKKRLTPDELDNCLNRMRGLVQDMYEFKTSHYNFILHMAENERKVKK